MDDIKKALNRKVGKLVVWQWLVIAIVGVLLGLALKRALGRNTQLATVSDIGVAVSELGGTSGAASNSSTAPDFSGSFVPESFSDDVGERLGDPNLSDVRIDIIPDFVLDPVPPSEPDQVGSDSGVVPVTPVEPKSTILPNPITVPQSTSYTVRKGDTLRSIASNLLGDADRNIEIRAINPQHTGSWDLLRIGEVLNIPAR